MKKKLLNRSSRRAQTLVEFALVLPILTMLVFGLLEVGRMAFVYATIATASREAVRYGAASGLNITGGINKYRDCAGIRSAAQKVDFLNVFTDENIVITYHDQLDNTFASCPVGGTGPAIINSGDRIKVVVSGDFIPIVRMIPLTERTVANLNPVTSSNYRTLIGSVDVPLVWKGGTSEGGTGWGGDVFPLDKVDRCPYKYGIDDYGEIGDANYDEEIPAGMIKDSNGNCFDIIDGDYCPNWPGNQKDFEAGWIMTADNECVDLNEIDYCTNITGIQSDIPYLMTSLEGTCSCTPPNMIIQDAQCVCASGYILDNGACIVDPNAPTPPPLEDLCPGGGIWAGIDNPIPPGYIKENGICIEIPYCTFSQTGSVPTVIVTGNKTTQTTWGINNTTTHPLTIDSIYIRWNDSDSKLYLSQINFGTNFSFQPNNNVSGFYYPNTPIIIGGSSSLSGTLTFSYNREVPVNVIVNSNISVMFNQNNCKFDLQPTCSGLKNELRSDCDLQN